MFSLPQCNLSMHVQNFQQMSNGTLGIPNCTVLGAVSAKCPFHPLLHIEVSQTMGHFGILLFIHCTMKSNQHTVTISRSTNGLDWLRSSFIPICYALYLLSIPSHCTMKSNQHTVTISRSTNGLDWLRSSFIPICYALYLLSIPSHCTMGGIGIVQTVPFATTCPYFLSHPGKEWTDWDHTKVSHFLCPVPTTYCPSHPTVPWEGMDKQGRVVPKCPISHHLQGFFQEGGHSPPPGYAENSFTCKSIIKMVNICLYKSSPSFHLIKGPKSTFSGGACPQTPQVCHTLCPQIHTCPSPYPWAKSWKKPWPILHE